MERIINLIAVFFLSISLTYSQSDNRQEVCQSIPDLTGQQKSEIDKLALQHQEKMDALVRVDGSDEFVVYAAPVGKVR